MSHIAKLKLCAQAQLSRGQLPPKERARARAIEYLRHQRALVQGVIANEPYLPYRAVSRTDGDGQRVRVQEPTHIRRGWFEDASGKVFFTIRYGAKPLPLDKTGNSAIEVGKLEALPEIIDTLIAACTAGELDQQLTTAQQERRKTFTRRKSNSTKAG